MEPHLLPTSRSRGAEVLSRAPVSLKRRKNPSRALHQRWSQEDRKIGSSESGPLSLLPLFRPSCDFSEIRTIPRTIKLIGALAAWRAPEDELGVAPHPLDRSRGKSERLG